AMRKFITTFSLLAALVCAVSPLCANADGKTFSQRSYSFQKSSNQRFRAGTGQMRQQHQYGMSGQYMRQQHQYGTGQYMRQQHQYGTNGQYMRQQHQY